MDMSPQEYQAYIKQKSPKSPIWKDTALAFLIGGFYALTPRGFLVSNAILVDLLETMEP